MGWLDDTASILTASTTNRSHGSHGSKKHHHSHSHSQHHQSSSSKHHHGGSHSHSHSHSHRSRSRSRSRGRPSLHHTQSTPSFFSFGGLGGAAGGTGSSRARHERNELAGIFGLGAGSHSGEKRGWNASRSSFFGFDRTRSKRSAQHRSGFIQRMYRKLRRLLRDLLYYAKRNPIKVFVLVVMPLITGGALSGLLRRFGIRLPAGLEQLFRGLEGKGHGSGSGFGSGTMLGRDGHGDLRWERSSGHGYPRDEGFMSTLGGLGNVASVMAGSGGVGGAVGLAKMFL